MRAAGARLLAVALFATAGCDASAATGCLDQLKPPGEVHGSLGVFLPCSFEAPACGQNDPAYHAVPGAQLVFSSTACGGRTFGIRTAGDGTYDLVLPEGSYAVAVEGGRPAAVAVVSGRRVELNLREDLNSARRFTPIASG